jgi:hypothetical protein
MPSGIASKTYGTVAAELADRRVQTSSVRT